MNVPQPRYPVVRNLVLGAVLSAGAGVAFAQDYPAKPVRLVLGFAPGGVADLTSRLLSQSLGERMGQPVLVDNRPGAGGIVAAEQVARAAPDGHTLALITNGNAVAVSLMKSLPYDPLKDFTMVVPFAAFGLVIVTGRDSPIRSVQDILSLAKSAPQKITLGSINIGSTQHLSTTLFKAQAGTEINSVTYKGTPALMAAVQSGEVQVGFEVLSPILAQVTGGSVRAVAVTTAKRFEGLPAVPTVAESGLPQFVVEGWNGIAAPAKTARPVIDRLNREVNTILGQGDFRRRLTELAVTPLGGSPEDLVKLMGSEIKRWGVIVTQAKIERQ